MNAVACALGSTFNKVLVGAEFKPYLAGTALTVGLVYLAVLLVTFLPAVQSSRLRPAEALSVTG